MKKLMPLTLFTVGFALAAPLHAADVAAGKAKADESCVDCHYEDGKGDADFPAIAGLTVEDFTKAIKEYQDGTRNKSPKMTKEAKKLSDTDIADLAAYYATLK
jgi:cytochrome c